MTPQLLQTAKHFYSDNQSIFFVAENTNMKGLNWWLGAPLLQLLTPQDLNKDDSPAPQAEDFDLSLTLYDEHRVYHNTTAEETSVAVELNHDAMLWGNGYQFRPDWLEPYEGNQAKLTSVLQSGQHEVRFPHMACRF
jgi:hypothetical protein